MNGPGHLPPSPPRASGGAVVLRVVFMLIPPLTIGLAAWAPMLRIALLRRRTLDWVLFAATVVVGICGLALGGGTPEDEWTSDVGVVLILLLAVGVPFYYLYVDLRLPHGGRPLKAAPYAHPYPYAAPAAPMGPAGPVAPAPFAPQAPVAYPPYPGAPHQDTPYPGAAYPGTPYPTVPHQDTPYPAVPHRDVPPPAAPAASPRPAGPRIDQVRAELDELSDYLRKHEDGR